jgi:hypothetical protein
MISSPPENGIERDWRLRGEPISLEAAQSFLGRFLSISFGSSRSAKRANFWLKSHYAACFNAHAARLVECIFVFC